jgi:hypothetical protein
MPSRMKPGRSHVLYMDEADWQILQDLAKADRRTVGDYLVIHVIDPVRTKGNGSRPGDPGTSILPLPDRGQVDVPPYKGPGRPFKMA